MASAFGASRFEQGRDVHDSSRSGRPLPKRVRTSNACEQCRLKKIRCNGQRPVCASCQEMCKPCSYNHIPKKRGLQPGYHASLERRAHALELMCALYYDTYGDKDDFTTLVRSRIEGRPVEPETRGGELPPAIFNKWRSSSLYSQVEGMVSDRSSLDVSQEKLQSPSMTSGSAVSVDQSGSSAYGSTDQPSQEYVSPPVSNYHSTVISQDLFHSAQHLDLGTEELQLMNQQSRSGQDLRPRSLSNRESTFASTDEPAGRESSCDSPQCISDPSSSSEELPKLLAHTEELLELFFTFTHIWLPLVDKYKILSTFRRYPQTIHATNTPGQPNLAEIAVLWAILAYTSFQSSAREDHRDTVSPEVVYRTARTLISDGEDGFKIEHVQALTLLSLTCIGKGSVSASWVLIGLARRIATDIGLSYIEAIEQSQGSIRRRTFAACSVIEILIAAQLGRGSSLHELYCDGGTEAGASPASTSYPLALEEEGWEEWDTWDGNYLANNRISPGRHNKRPIRAIHVFNKLIQLSRILRNVLYFGRKSIPPTTRAIVRSKILEQLSSWYLEGGLDCGSESNLPHLINLQVWYVSVCNIFRHTFSISIVDTTDGSSIPTSKDINVFFDLYKSAFGFHLAPSTFPFFAYVALSGNTQSKSNLSELLLDVDRTWYSASIYIDLLEKEEFFGSQSWTYADRLKIAQSNTANDTKAYLTTFPSQLYRFCVGGSDQNKLVQRDRSSRIDLRPIATTEIAMPFVAGASATDAASEQQGAPSHPLASTSSFLEPRDSTASAIRADTSIFNVNGISIDSQQGCRMPNSSSRPIGLSKTYDASNVAVTANPALDERMITLDEVDWYDSVARITSYLFPNKVKAG